MVKLCQVRETTLGQNSAVVGLATADYTSPGSCQVSEGRVLSTQRRLTPKTSPPISACCGLSEAKAAYETLPPGELPDFFLLLLLLLLLLPTLLTGGL